MIVIVKIWRSKTWYSLIKYDISSIVKKCRFTLCFAPLMCTFFMKNIDLSNKCSLTYEGAQRTSHNLSAAHEEKLEVTGEWKNRSPFFSPRSSSVISLFIPLQIKRDVFWRVNDARRTFYFLSSGMKGRETGINLSESLGVLFTLMFYYALSGIPVLSGSQCPYKCGFRFFRAWHLQLMF